jgi:signal transduction histidine kinase
MRFGPARHPSADRILLRRSIFTKYFLSFFILVSLLLLISGAIDSFLAYEQARGAAVQLQAEKAEAAAQRTEQFIAEIERQIGWTTHAQWAIGTAEERRLDYFRLLRQVPAVTELTQLDPSGREVLKVSRLAKDVVGGGTDYSAEPLFREALSNRVWFSPVYFRKESEPYLTISLAHGSDHGGVTFAQLNLKLIWDVISSIKVGRSGYAYVVDRQGRVLAHPDIGLVLRNTDLSGLPQVRAALATSASSGISQGSTPDAADPAGRSMVSAYAPIPRLGWLVFVDLPLGEALAPLYASLWQTALLLCGGLVFSALGGFLLTGRMVGPIRRLQEGAVRLGRGDLSYRMDIHTGDELERLADGLNSMAGQIDEAHRSLEAKVHERTRELTEALTHQTATSNVLNVISRSPAEIQPVLDAIAKAAADLCSAEYASIARPRDGSLHVVAANKVELAHLQFLLRNPTAINRDTVTGRVALERRTIQVTDVLADPEFKRHDWQEIGKQRTVLGVPLIRDRALLGVIILARTEVRPFTEKQVELVTTFADQAVIAIENVRLFQEVQERTAELQESLEYQTATSDVLNAISRSPSQIQPVLETIVETAARLCEANDTQILLRDEDALGVAIHRGSIPLHSGKMPIARGSVTGRAVADREPVHVHDLCALEEEFPEGHAIALRLGVRTILATPLMRKDVAIGVIVVRRGEVRPFSEKQIAVLQTFADQAVIAIENVRLFDEVQARTRELARSVQELEALREVSQAVNSTLDLETVLSTIVAKAVQLSATDAGAIYVFSNLRRKFRLRATYGMTEELIQEIGKRSIGLSDIYLGTATRRREAVQVSDLEAEPSSPTRDLVLSAGYRGLLVIPLLQPDRIVGALVVRRRAPGLFPTSTIDLLQTFAAQSVLAIHNARLFSEIEQKSHEIETASRHKSQFLANMSHELRTPMNAVLGFTEMMADGLYGPLPEKALKALERVQANGKHLLGLINDVLDLSKIEAGQLTLALQDYAVVQVVNTVISGTESLAKAKGLALTAQVQDGLPLGRADERRLTQVLLNLVGNAIKFTERGSVEILAGASNGLLEISVHDTGPGIAWGDQKRIFEEFQQVDSSSTREKGGSGLGLAISKRLIEMHGGTLAVHSVLGEGSTFRIVMPLRGVEQTEAA